VLVFVPVDVLDTVPQKIAFVLISKLLLNVVDTFYASNVVMLWTVHSVPFFGSNIIQ
jgi:hypothetical protein